MRASQKLAGYSLEEADNLRKATGKKVRELIAKERGKFVEGCVRNGHTAEFAERYFDTIEPFADYSFNKSHSVGYGYITYQTAWLKANHPVPYLAALLTSVKSNLDKAGVYLNDCRQRGIDVLVPDVNASASDFACELAAEGGPTGRDPLRALGGAQRRRGRGRADHRRARRGSVRRLLRLLRAGRPDRAQQARDRVVDQGGRLRLARPSAQGPAPGVRAHRRRDAAPPARARPGNDEPVRPGRRRGRRQPGVRRPAPDPRRRLRQVREAARREGDARPLRERSPAHGRRSGAAPPRRVLDHRSGRARRRLDPHRRRRRHRPVAQVHQAGRPHGDVRAGGSRGRHRGDGVPQDDAPVRRAARRRRDRRGEGPQSTAAKTRPS